MTSEHNEDDYKPIPDILDVDSFLGRVEAEDAMSRAELAALDAETVHVERQVMDALQASGVGLGRLRLIQAIDGDHKPLLQTIDSLGKKGGIQMGLAQELLHALDGDSFAEYSDEAASQMRADYRGMIEAAYIITGIAIHKIGSTYENDTRAEYWKTKTQRELAANPDLGTDPEYRAKWLAAVDVLYPGVTGLDFTDPDVLLAVNDEEAAQAAEQEIYDRAQVLRPLVRASLAAFLQVEGIGHHDQLESFLGVLAVHIARSHVMETGDYDGVLTVDGTTNVNYREAIDIVSRYEASRMGWTNEQFDAAVEYARRALETDE